MLLQRKNTGYQDGKYGLPSGHMDGGELATHAAAREAKEETGVVINPADLKFVHATHRLDAGVSSERVEFFFEASKWQGEPVNAEPEKCSDLAWFSVTELPAATIPLVRRVIQLSDTGVRYSEYAVELTGSTRLE